MKSEIGGTIGVVGAGTMGRGIAQLCLQSGFQVRLHDALDGAAERGRGAVEQALDKAVEKGKLSAEQALKAKRALTVARGLDDLAACGLVIEAVSEDLEIKRKLFQNLDALVSPEAVLATNTSSLPVREIAAAVARPARVLGIHFFNPPVAMRLVELVRAPGTADAAFARAREFALALGRVPVSALDTPGFIVNRVVRPFYIESQRSVGEGWGAFADADRAVREQGGLPMGPFELMDLIGLDVNLAISRTIHAALGRPERLKPQALQERLVEAGALGRKASRGFYLYEDGKPAGENPEALGLLPLGRGAAEPERTWERVSGALIAEAELALAEGVAAEADIDTAVRLAMNFPKGPFQWRSERGQKA